MLTISVYCYYAPILTVQLQCQYLHYHCYLCGQYLYTGTMVLYWPYSYNDKICTTTVTYADNIRSTTTMLLYWPYSYNDNICTTTVHLYWQYLYYYYALIITITVYYWALILTSVLLLCSYTGNISTDNVHLYWQYLHSYYAVILTKSVLLILQLLIRIIFALLLCTYSNNKYL